MIQLFKTHNPIPRLDYGLNIVNLTANPHVHLEVGVIFLDILQVVGICFWHFLVLAKLVLGLNDAVELFGGLFVVQVLILFY